MAAKRAPPPSLPGRLGDLAGRLAAAGVRLQTMAQPYPVLSWRYGRGTWTVQGTKGGQVSSVSVAATGRPPVQLAGGTVAADTAVTATVAALGKL